MKKFLLLLLLSFSTYLFSYAQQSVTAKKISSPKLERRLKKDIQLVDVRTEKEFNEEHIEKAVNVDIEDPDFDYKIQALDKSKPIYLYCRSGKRSDKAAEKMASMGFTKIYDLKGGILGWQKHRIKSQ